MHFCLSDHAHSSLHFTNNVLERSSIPRSQLMLNNHFSVVNPSTTEGGGGRRVAGVARRGAGGAGGGKGCECDPVTYSMSLNIWRYLVLISVINTLTKSEIDLLGVVNPPPPLTQDKKCMRGNYNIPSCTSLCHI